MKKSKQQFSLIATLVALSFSTVASATDEHDGHNQHHNPPTPTPIPSPQVTMPISVKIEPTVSGTINQKAEIEQSASIKQTATTNSGNISNSATGGKVEIERGAFQNSVSGGNAIIERGAVQNNVNGGKVEVEEGAFKNTNNNKVDVDAHGGEGGNATATTGPITVNNITPAERKRTEALVMTTPNVMPVPTIPTPTSFYPQGVPNSVGSAGLVNAYENHCAIQMSGDNNIVRTETGHETIIAALDDQARMGGAKTAPEVRIVKTPQQLAPNSGRCLCLGTLQVESTIEPDEARQNNMQTIHAAAGKWTRQNLRGFKQVQLLYVPNQSVTFQKGTAAHAGSAGIGAAVSGIISHATMGVVSPSLGRTNGHTTDYPIVGVTYLMVGTIDGNEPPESARTVDMSLLMNQVEKMPPPQAWGVAPAAQPVQQAATVAIPEVKQ